MRALLVAVAAAAVLSACGADSSGGATPPSDLSPAAQAGYDVYRDAGCAACHGAAGEGGVGPRLAGVYGTNVELSDGSTVVADDAYLTTSIKDPNAQKVAGYNVPMPQNNLSDQDVAAVVAYLRELGGESAVPGL